MTVSPSDSNPIAQMFDWLAVEPADDCLLDLVALRRHLKPLVDGARSVPGLLRCAELVAVRVLDVSDRFRPRLLAVTLPLPRELHAGVVDTIRALLDVAAIFQDFSQGAAEPADTHAANAATQAMKLISEAHLLGCMGGIEAPRELWMRAHQVARLTGPLEEGVFDADAITGATSAVAGYKQIAAIAVLQPESLTARELVWVSEYLEVVAGAAELSRRQIQPDVAVFWIDVLKGGGPIAQVRRAPPVGEDLLYFRALRLARRAGEQIDWLESKIADAEVVGLERDGDLLEPEVSGLPLGLTPVEVLSLLRRMRDHWTTPGSRELPRRTKLYAVQVCQGLREIWRMHQSGAVSEKVVEWMVYNESPGGFAIISVGGVEGVLSAGMALALRRGPGGPWTICIVRWIRNEKPEEIELGLQVVAEGCAAVSVGFRGSALRATSPALLLPPRVGRRNDAILATAGTYSSRRFVLVREGSCLYVAQGRVLSLDLQTANVELFQYEIDPYPI